LVLVAAAGVLSADRLVTLYAPAFRLVPGKHEMAVFMTQILWPFLPLVVLAAVWMGILNSRDRYAVPSLAPSFFNFASIVSAFTLCPFFSWWLGWPAIYGMAVGAVIGGLLQWLVQVPALRKEGFRFHWNFDFKDPDLRRMVVLMGAGTFGLAATQINIMVNSILASGAGDGAVSWLNYAFRLMQFPIGVFGVAISTANLTKVAKTSHDLSAVSDAVTEALRLVLVLSVPSAFGLAFLGIPIISVIYEHGVFHAADTHATAMALAGYSLGLVAYSGIKVMVPVLYSLGMARSAVWSSGLSVAVNVVLCFAFVGRWGFMGLAFATSIAAIINAFVLLFILEKRLKQINFKSLLRCLAATLLASGCMAIIVYLLQAAVGIVPFSPIPLTGPWVKATFLEHLTFLFVGLAAAMVVYFLVAKLCGLKELKEIQEIVWKRFARTKGIR
jgi:putative peptidoglycan lipid II flippase